VTRGERWADRATWIGPVTGIGAAATYIVKLALGARTSSWYQASWAVVVILWAGLVLYQRRAARAVRRLVDDQAKTIKLQAGVIVRVSELVQELLQDGQPPL
jgi:hypothetical protein